MKMKYSCASRKGLLHATTIRLVAAGIWLLLQAVPVRTSGQQQKGLISLHLRDASLVRVFDGIKNQTGYEFLYNSTMIKGAKRVSIDVDNASVEAVLNKCLEGQPFTYVIQGESILVILQKEGPPAKTALPAPPGPDTITVSGQVIDGNSGQPVPGTTILEKMTGKGTVSDGSGKFQVSGISNTNAVLQFRSIGYETQEIKASGGRFFTIRLQPATKALDETVVIAYGTTTRRMNTGSVSTVTAKEIESQPVSNPLAALQGLVPGLVISQESGVSGASFKVQIRGQSSLDLSLSQNDPLFIIDGVPFESGNTTTSQINSAANNPTSVNSGGLSPLNLIPPSDIESIEVLKDADATSIYGSRGSNGVILITTKKGKQGRTMVNLNSYTGWSRIGRSVKMLNTQQYVAMRKEAFTNDGFQLSTNPSDNGFAPDIMLWDTSRYTDFKKMLIGNTGHTSDVRLSVSGGSANTQFLIGGGYHKETSVYPGSFSDQVASMHFNIGHSSLDKKFTIALTGLYSNDNNKLPRYDLTKYLSLPPNLKLYDNLGNPSWQDEGIVYWSLPSASGIQNPLFDLQNTYASINENLTANLQLSYKILPGLTILSSMGYNTFYTTEKAISPSTGIDPATGVLPSAYFANANTKSWIIEPQLEYRWENRNNKLTVLLGGTFQDKTRMLNSQNGTDYSSDLLLNSISAAGSIMAFNDYGQYRYSAFFGRLNYTRDDKYIVNISARRDGSSRFGPEKQWANFASLGAAWLFANETFVKNTVRFLSYGKLRGSYGTTGNDQIGDYKFLNLWRNTAYPYSNVSGLYPTSLYNPDYSWEINKKFEVGLELGFLKDNILFSTAYYRNRCSNQLIGYSLPIETGFTKVVQNFPGLVQNTGFEFAISTKNFYSKNFRWTSSFNVSVPKNKLVRFPDIANTSYANQYIVGKSLSVIRAIKYLGVDPQTGLYTFEDANKDGTIAIVSDYQTFGNRDPKFYGGLQNTLAFKQFDLSFLFEFRKQIGLNYLDQLSNQPPGSLANQPDIVLSRWQKPGDIADIQRFSSGYAAVNSPANALGFLGYSNGKYTDASFVRLKNISLSYHPAASLTKKAGIRDLRIYLEGQNLLTITSYKGSDPETQNYYVLPPLKTIVVGIQLNF